MALLHTNVLPCHNAIVCKIYMYKLLQLSICIVYPPLSYLRYLPHFFFVHKILCSYTIPHAFYNTKSHTNILLILVHRAIAYCTTDMAGYGVAMAMSMDVWLWPTWFPIIFNKLFSLVWLTCKNYKILNK
jgi:hypothetical protein